MCQVDPVHQKPGGVPQGLEQMGHVQQVLGVLLERVPRELDQVEYVRHVPKVQVIHRELEVVQMRMVQRE